MQTDGSRLGPERHTSVGRKGQAAVAKGEAGGLDRGTRRDGYRKATAAPTFPVAPPLKVSELRFTGSSAGSLHTQSVQPIHYRSQAFNCREGS